MSTSLAPPFTLHYNCNKASHLDVDFITRSSYPTLKGQGYGVIIRSPVHRKVDECHNLKAPFGSGNGLGPKATSHRLYHWWRIQLAPLKGSELIQARGNQFHQNHYRDVLMSALTSQITRASIVCLTFCWGADQRKHQSSASLAPVRGIHRWPVGPLTKGQ